MGPVGTPSDQTFKFDLAGPLTREQAEAIFARGREAVIWALMVLSANVWKPALIRAGLVYREMQQTRHSFATLALSSGANLLWIAKVLGHRNTEMIFEVYGKYIEQVNNDKDYGFLNDIYQVGPGNDD